MNHFDTIESAQEYLDTLSASLAETKSEVEAELVTLDKRTRRFNGLMVARYKFELLDRHLKNALKLLNDLRRLADLC